MNAQKELARIIGEFKEGADFAEILKGSYLYIQTGKSLFDLESELLSHLSEEDIEKRYLPNSFTKYFRPETYLESPYWVTDDSGAVPVPFDTIEEAFESASENLEGE